MNPHECDWRSPIQRLQTGLEPDHQRLVSSSRMERVPRITDHWETRPMDTAVQPHSGSGAWREPSPPSLNSPDPDGNPLHSEDEEDPELARKKQELQELHEQIIHKKATIAIKAIKMIVKNPSEPDAHDEEEFDTCNPETLRDRVTEILHQRSFSFFSKVKLSKLKAKATTLRKDEVKQQHHPLKLRVKALKAYRLRDPRVLPPNREKVLYVPPPPTTRSVTSPVKEESSAVKGFERFLNVLNRGADLNLKHMVPDVPLPPPDHSITLPAKQQESTSTKEYEHLLKVLNKVAAAAPNMNTKVPDVPLRPPDRSITSPEKQQSPTSKGYERFLSLLNKGAAPNLNTTVRDVPLIPPARSSISTAKEEDTANKGYERLLSVLNKGATINLKTMIPDVSLNPPSHSDPHKIKKETSTNKGPEDENRASRSYEHTERADRHSERKSSGSIGQKGSEQESSASRKSESKDDRRSDHEKNVDRRSDCKTSPKRGYEGKSCDSRASEHKKSVDRGSDLEHTINRRSGGKSDVNIFEHESSPDRSSKHESSINRRSEVKSSVNSVSFESKNSADRGSESEKSLDRPEHKSSVHKVFERVNRGSGIENILDRSSEHERSVNRGSVNKHFEGKSSLSRSFEPESSVKKSPESDSSASQSSGHKNNGDRASEPESSVSRSFKSESEKDRGFKSESSVNKGFERFVSLLNSGVDITKLSKMIKDDLPKTSPSLEKAPKSESQKSDSGFSLPGCSGIRSVKSKTDSVNQEPSSPVDGEVKKVQNRSSVNSSSQSEPTFEVKKTKKEETANTDEKKKQVQSLLKTLGVNLDVEELTRLTDRTQERLFGRKNEDRQTSNSRKEQESQLRLSHKKHSRSRSSSSSSSSTSSSSTSSRSASRSRSRSPLRHRRHRRSRSRDAHRRSRDRGRDGVKRHSRSEASKEAQRPSYRNHQHLFPSPYSAPSAYTDYNLYQYAQYMNYYNAYNSAINSNWVFDPNQSQVPPISLNPHSHSQQQSVLGDMRPPTHRARLSLQELMLLMNPDLSVSEGQSTEPSSFRCLTVVNTKPSSESSAMEHRWLTRNERSQWGSKSKKREKNKRKTPEKTEDFSQIKTEEKFEKKPTETLAAEKKASETVAMEKKVAETVATGKKTIVSKPSQGSKGDDKAKSKEEKKQLTEEEIKANLRARLLEFNRKARLMTQPSSNIKPLANSLDSELL